MKKRLLKKWDIILIASALAVSAVFLICLSRFSSDGDFILVKVDNFTVAELPLHQDIKYEIETDNGISNILEISNGEARMLSADCPDKICMNHKSISKQNDTIVCLPNKVLITVVSETENDVDGVAK